MDTYFLSIELDFNEVAETVEFGTIHSKSSLRKKPVCDGSLGKKKMKENYTNYIVSYNYKRITCPYHTLISKHCGGKSPVGAYKRVEALQFFHVFKTIPIVS